MQQYFVVTNREIAIGRKILDAYKSKTGIFEGYYSEAQNDISIRRPLYLNYITFTNAIDYEKYMDPNKLWKASKEWVQTYPWLFEPQQLFDKRVGTIVEAFHEIGQKYRGIFRPKDIGVWLPTAEVLLGHGGDTIAMLKSFNFDASEIFTALNSISKKDFPIISGVKTLPRWLRILWEDAKVPLKAIEKVPLPVDRSTAQATYTLLFKIPMNSILDKRRKDLIESTWRQIADKLDKPLISFDAPLRFLGLNHKRLRLAANWLSNE